MPLTQTSRVDYEELCKLVVFGLADSPSGDQGVVYDRFKEQLWRSEEGWYETALPWKGNHSPLPNNKVKSLRRLASLVQKLEKNGSIDDYNAVIQEQWDKLGDFLSIIVPTEKADRTKRGILAKIARIYDLGFVISM